jgi:epsilon-lactone hydrolase
MIPIRAAVRTTKGARWTVDARPPYDAFIGRVQPPDDVPFESGTVGGIPGLWVRPASSRTGDAIPRARRTWPG